MAWMLPGPRRERAYHGMDAAWTCIPKETSKALLPVASCTAGAAQALSKRVQGQHEHGGGGGAAGWLARTWSGPPSSSPLPLHSNRAYACTCRRIEAGALLHSAPHPPHPPHPPRPSIAAVRARTWETT